MAVRRINKVWPRTGGARREPLPWVKRGGSIESAPRLVWLLLAITPLLVGCTLLVPVNGSAALLCGAAAGAAVIAWPWWRLYWAMREHDREHPEERRRPWWQRWPWGSPPVPQPKTRLDRFFEALGLVSATGLGLMVLAWMCGIL